MTSQSQASRETDSTTNSAAVKLRATITVDFVAADAVQAKMHEARIRQACEALASSYEVGPLDVRARRTWTKRRAPAPPSLPAAGLPGVTYYDDE